MKFLHIDFTRTISVFLVLSIAMTACKKDDDDSSDDGDNTPSTFNNRVNISGLYDDEVNWADMKNDQYFVVGETDKFTDTDAFAVLFDNNGSEIFNKTHSSIRGLTNCAIISDGVYIAQDNNRSPHSNTLYIFNSEGVIATSFDPEDNIKTGLSISTDINVEQVMVNSNDEIILAGSVPGPNDNDWVAQIDQVGNYVKGNFIPGGVVENSTMLSNNGMAIWDGLNNNVVLLDSDFNVTATVDVSGLVFDDSWTSLPMIARPDVDGFYLARHKFSNDGSYLFKVDLPSTFPEYHSSVANDGGLIVGTFLANAANQNSFYLQKFSTSDGSSEWLNHVVDAPPFRADFPRQLSNDFIMGTSHLFGGDSIVNIDITVFKVNGSGEF